MSSSSASRPQTVIYVSGLSNSSDEQSLVNAFQPFGEIIEVHLPRQRQTRSENEEAADKSHRGFGFVMFSTSVEAEDAIDNMHLNEVDGRIVTVTLARPSRGDGTQLGAERDSRKPIWADEEWIKQYGTEAQSIDTVPSS